jgi:formate dehydrogenase major subunit
MAATDAIVFHLDGRAVSAAPGETILVAAQRHGVEIPHLCHTAGLAPAGNCRACVVEIDGERTLAPSCCRAPSAGMVVHSTSARARAAQKIVLELLQSDAPPTAHTRASELAQWSERLGVGRPRFAARVQPPADLSHPAFEVHLDACIHCTRCIRACRDEQVNDVLGMAGRGAQARIVFDQADGVAASSCVACGECVQACPTGALVPAGGEALQLVARQVRSVCPYCGVGCQLSYAVGTDTAERDVHGRARILHARGEHGPANHGRLCVKGRFGYDYVASPERLTRPLVRRDGVPKAAADIERLACGDIRREDLFREATWEEALDRAAAGLARIRDATPTGADPALAGFGSAKGSNEEAYLFQKLVRTGFRTHNVDHCTRLCHASSVAALLEGVGSGAVSNPVADVAQAEVIFLIGANPTTNHPVAASWIKNAVKRGATLIVADPRRNELSRHARWHLAFQPGTDVALLNALLHVILAEGLVDAAFLAARVSDTETLRAAVAEATPERMSAICGIDAETLRAVARAYATSKASMILWGMGISQHVHGTDNARGLIALAMCTGQIGRPGTGLHPLRGQNNVQGASDAGLIPMMLPGYQRVATSAARMSFEQSWGSPLAERPGLTVVEILHAAREGRIRGMFIEGENPAMSDPDLGHARAGLAALEHLVVQDIFLTETAALADVVLPASAQLEKWGSYTNTDRLVQVGRPVLDPPGDARQDLWVIHEIAARLGLPWRYWTDADGDGREAREAPVARVYEEMRSAMDVLAGIPWQRLAREGAAMYPSRDEADRGEAVMFRERFATDDGRAHLVPTRYAPGPEQREDAYPLTLSTGRVLEHWHTGAMTRRARVLDALAPTAPVALHPADIAALDLSAGQTVRVVSRHGSVEAVLESHDGVQRGQAFMPFAYVEAAANRLTGDALDPVAKIPGFKVTAVRVEGVQQAAGSPWAAPAYGRSPR